MVQYLLNQPLIDISSLVTGFPKKVNNNDEYERKYLKEISHTKLIELKKINKLYNELTQSKKTTPVNYLQFSIMSQPKLTSKQYIAKRINHKSLDYEIDDKLNFRLTQHKFHSQYAKISRKVTKNLPKMQYKKKTLEDFLKEEDDVRKDNKYLEDALNVTNNEYDESDFNEFKKMVGKQPKISVKKDEIEQLKNNLHSLRQTVRNEKKSKSNFLELKKIERLKKIGNEEKIKHFMRDLDDNMNKLAVKRSDKVREYFS